MNFFLHVVILIFFVHPIHLRRLNLEEYDLYEIKKVSKYNETRLKYGLDPIFFSRELMYFAQEEAGRLAKLGLLEVPKLKTEKSYRGFSVRITEQDGKTFCKYLMDKYIIIFLVVIKCIYFFLKTEKKFASIIYFQSRNCHVYWI